MASAVPLDEQPYVRMASLPTVERRSWVSVAALVICIMIAKLVIAFVLATRHTGMVQLSQSILPVCVFIHGAGVEQGAAATVEQYWGLIRGRLISSCAALVFMNEDTLRRGWDDSGLQRSVCTLVLDAIAEKGAPLVIFSHSMGTLLLAGALQNGVCALPDAAAWYSVAAPWNGSKAAELLPAICAGGQSLSSAPAMDHRPIVGPMLRALARRERFCEGEGNGPSPGFASTRSSNAALGAIARWQARLNGTLCGDSAFGLWSSDSFGLQALADLSRFGQPNDGAVPTAGCHPPSAHVARSPDSRHFTAAVNHYDLACRHGDGSIPWSGDDRNPCAWYQAMVVRGR